VSKIKKIIIKIYYLIRFFNYPQRVLVPDTFRARELFNSLDHIVHWNEYRLRTKLAKKYLDINTIKLDSGYGRSQSSLNTEIDFISSYAKSIDWDKYGNKKSFLQSVPFRYGVIKELDALITSDEIIGPIASYFGLFPVFSNARIFYSPNTENFELGSQSPHLDSEDIRQIKCWIPLDDISSNSGPLNILPANKSRSVYEKLLKNKLISRRNVKLSDAIFSKYSNNNEWIQCTGAVGDLIFTDTCRCYHFGSRKAKTSRLVLMLHYFMPSSMEVPFLIRKKKVYQDEELTYLLGYQEQLFINKYRSN